MHSGLVNSANMINDDEDDKDNDDNDPSLFFSTELYLTIFGMKKKSYRK